MVATDIAESIKASRTIEALRGTLRTLYMATLAKKDAQAMYDEIATGVKQDLAAVDGENGDGVRFVDHTGAERAAILSKPKDEISWDVAKTAQKLRERGLWDKCSTRVLDPNKLASEIAAGTVAFTEDELSELQVITKSISPSVRFVNSKPDSK
jgi:hypothetical protein